MSEPKLRDLLVAGAQDDDTEAAHLRAMLLTAVAGLEQYKEMVLERDTELAALAAEVERLRKLDTAQVLYNALCKRLITHILESAPETDPNTDIELRLVSLIWQRDALAERVAELEKGHCRDCCCARSWEALGISNMTGLSIPEEIAELKRYAAEGWDVVADKRDECKRLAERIAKLRERGAELKRIGLKLSMDQNAAESYVEHLEATIAKLRGALEDVLADHDERVNAYGDREKQPNRIAVMSRARAALEESHEE